MLLPSPQLIQIHLVVDVHSSTKQHLYNRQVSIACGEVEWCMCECVCVCVEQVGVGTQQQLDDLEATVECSEVQWSLKAVVPHGGVG